MHTFRRSRRQARGRTRGLIAAAFALAWVSAAAPSPAACIDAPDPGMRNLQRLIQRDANQALAQIDLKLNAARGGADARLESRLAALYEARAEAYEILERSGEALDSAASGLKLATNPHDPVHLALLLDQAANSYEQSGIEQAETAVETARAGLAPASRAGICFLIARGLLEHRLDRDDLAIGSLSQAYRASDAPAVAEPHILSAAALSVVMRSMGDYEQALALIQEKVDWDAARGANLSLSVSRFMQGRILQLMGNNAAAIEQFELARKLSGTLHDRQGVAFSDLRTCEAHIDLGEFTAAQAECASAGRIFAASTDLESVKETQALEARIELGLGRPARARALLDKVLDRNGADLPPRDVAPMFDARARANADLQSYEEAYRDLREYTNRYVAATEADRRRQAGTLRARFETDREIERNAALKRELASSLDRADRQARQLRQNEIVAGTGGLVIALLAYLLVMSFRYRRRMVKLANIDGLTGLPNRRRVSHFAETALQTARATGEPLAIAIMDMDHFKEINDCCGHATGDHVLKEFARIGAEALRPCDMLGRWGGEEFLLVMPGAEISVAQANLERLRTLMCGIRLPPLTGAGLPVTLSAGIAEHCANVRSLDDMIARADRALYAAKSAGRDCVRVADMTQITGSHAVRRVQRQ